MKLKVLTLTALAAAVLAFASTGQAGTTEHCRQMITVVFESPEIKRAVVTGVARKANLNGECEYAVVSQSGISTTSLIMTESYSTLRVSIKAMLFSYELAQIMITTEMQPRKTYGTLYVVKNYDPISIYRPIRYFELQDITVNLGSTFVEVPLVESFQ